MYRNYISHPSRVWRNTSNYSLHQLAQKACNNQKACTRVLTLLNLGIPQCCRAKLMTFLQLGHQQEIPSISEMEKKKRITLLRVAMNILIVWQCYLHLFPSAITHTNDINEITRDRNLEIEWMCHLLGLIKCLWWPFQVTSSITMYSNSFSTLKYWETNPVKYLCL